MSGKLSEEGLDKIREGVSPQHFGGFCECFNCEAVNELLQHIAAIQSERDELLRACEAAKAKADEAFSDLSGVCPVESDTASKEHLDDAEQSLCAVTKILQSAIARAQGEKGDAAEKRERELADIDLINEGDK